MDRDYVKAKLECQINQAKVKGLIISLQCGWGVYKDYKRKKYIIDQLQYSNHIYITSLLIEGESIQYDLCDIAARALHISSEEMRTFNVGFCRGGNTVNYNEGSNLHFANALGDYFKVKLGL